jgi:lipid-binding SYLF domain-containing protein
MYLHVERLLRSHAVVFKRFYCVHIVDRGSEGAVKVFHKPQVNIGAGLDLAVGPYGRAAQAAVGIGAGGLGANYSYSQSKGFFAGISLKGTLITTRNDLNSKFYGREISPAVILSGEVRVDMCQP